MILLAATLTALQYGLGFFLLYNQQANLILRGTGWAIWLASCIFGFLPMFQ